MTSLTDRPRARLSRKPIRERLRNVRRPQARQARVARRWLERNHERLPKQVHALFDPHVAAFSRPTRRRFVRLALAAILTLGGRTITDRLRVLGALAPGHPRCDHRAFSRNRSSLSTLARRYVAAVRARFVPSGAVLWAGDDTVTEPPGPHLDGKGRHRDPVRSTHSSTALRWGHKGVVLALLVPVPWATRRRALPLWVALDRPEEENPDRGRRHQTPAPLFGQRVRIRRRWFPDRALVVTADGHSATHELAELAARAPRWLTWVSWFDPDAHLVGPPPESAGQGRPRVTGTDLPGPAEVVTGAEPRQALGVPWYGGGRRRVETMPGTGLWSRSGRRRVERRRVFVHDLSGTHRESSFFTTDPARSARSLIETATGRGNIETTFEEVRSSLRVETTRGWRRDTVRRVGPCLFGLSTIVAWLSAELPGRWWRARLVNGPGKRDVTCSDAITAVRRWLWLGWVWATPGHRDAFQKLTPGFRPILLNGLAQAA